MSKQNDQPTLFTETYVPYFYFGVNPEQNQVKSSLFIGGIAIDDLVSRPQLVPEYDARFDLAKDTGRLFNGLLKNPGAVLLTPAEDKLYVNRAGTYGAEIANKIGQANFDLSDPFRSFKVRKGVALAALERKNRFINQAKIAENDLSLFTAASLLIGQTEAEDKVESNLVVVGAIDGLHRLAESIAMYRNLRLSPEKRNDSEVKDEANFIRSVMDYTLLRSDGSSAGQASRIETWLKRGALWAGRRDQFWEEQTSSISQLRDCNPQMKPINSLRLFKPKAKSRV